MKKRELFIIGYIAVILILICFTINKIYAARITATEIGETTEKQVSYGFVYTKQNGEVTVKEAYIRDNLKFENEEAVREWIESQDVGYGIYREDLEDNSEIFCIAENYGIPYTVEMSQIRILAARTAVETLCKTMGEKYMYANTKTDREVKNWATTSNTGGDIVVDNINRNTRKVYGQYENYHKEANTDETVVFTNDLRTFTESSSGYRSRAIKEGSIKVRTVGTKNAKDVANENKVINWNEAYIMSQVEEGVQNATGLLKGNLYQYALWDALRMNDRKVEVLSEDGIRIEQKTLGELNPKEEEYRDARNNFTQKDEYRLVGEANAFKEYREQKDYNRTPSVEDTEYKFYYVEGENGNDYLLAGPIKIDYNDQLTQSYTYGSYDVKADGTPDYSTSLSVSGQIKVRKINSYDLYGKDRNGKEVKLSKDEYYFTDKNGNKLANNLTITTEDKNPFPKSQQEFYIKVPYTKGQDKIYDKIEAVSRFKFDFSHLDSTAKAYECYGGVIEYYKWKAVDNTGEKTASTIGKHTGCYADAIRTVPAVDPTPREKEIDTTITKDPNSTYPNERFDQNKDQPTQYQPITFTMDGIHFTNALVGYRPLPVPKAGGKEHHIIHESYLVKTGEKNEKSNLQFIWILGEARLYWVDYEIEIEFTPDGGDGNPPPSETPSTGTPAPPTGSSPSPIIPPSHTPIIPPSHQNQTYIDIGGKVFVDMPITTKDNTKEGNNVYDEEDYLRKNVLAKLYFEDGTPVKLGLNTLANGKSVTIVNTKNQLAYNETDGMYYYEMYTNDNGEYMFYDLPMGYKYYVEFTYDGMTYEIVNYMASGSESWYINSIRNRDIKEVSKYYNDSLVRSEIARQSFNNKFKRIEGRETIKNEKTSGTAIDKSEKNVTLLEYVSKDFRENKEGYGRYESRLITTDNNLDVENGKNDNGEDTRVKTVKQTGIARSEYEMKARSKLNYPVENSYIVWDTTNKHENLEYLRHINLGLKLRDEVDFSINATIKAGATTIKDKEKVVFYGLKNSGEDIDITNQVDEYVKYEIAAADYNWRKELDNIYGENNNLGFDVVKDQLNVYVLYKMDLKEETGSNQNYGVITGLVDYFGKELEVVTDTEEITRVKKLFGKKEDNSGFNIPSDAKTSWYEANGISMAVEWEQTNNVKGYNTIKTKNLKIELGKDTDTATVYLILKVANDKNDDKVLYTAKDNGMKNIAEIASYEVYNNNGNVAGLVDRDSAPENAVPGDKTTYEDDTDDAPMFQLIINWNVKKISGNVWDDINKTGIRDNGQGIENVQVELVEYIYNKNKGTFKEVVRPGLTVGNKSIGTEKDDRGNPIKSKRTDKNGYYEYYVEGGNYQIRFTYGDQEMLLNPDVKKYNAQDYMASKRDNYKALHNSDNRAFIAEYSKTEQPYLRDYINGKESMLVIDNFEYDFKAGYGTNARAEFDLQTKAEEILKHVMPSKNMSNARENANTRAKLIQDTAIITNELGSLLNQLNEENEIDEDTVSELEGYTKMTCLSDIIVIPSNDLVDNNRQINPDKVVNLGLEERPKTSINMKKEVTRIVLSTADGVSIIDTDDVSKLTNLAKDPEDQSLENTLIYLDAVAEDGAVIDIYYTITVTNEGEPDTLRNYEYETKQRNNKGNDTYILTELMNTLNNKEIYNFELSSLDADLPIRANTIYDYVNMNLEFRATDNPADKDKRIIKKWEKVYDEEDEVLVNGGKNELIKEMITDDVKDAIKRDNLKVNKVLKTTTNDIIPSKDKDDPKKTDTVSLHLGISLAENTGVDLADEFVYSNCAEIVEVYSAAGRRDYDAVPGNDIPYNTEVEHEHDYNMTGTTTIIPPTGEDRATYITLPIISASIIIIGIIIIKKRVLGKNK